MKETMYCQMCEAEQKFRPETRREEYEVRGDKIALEVPRLVCLNCGEAVVDETFGDPTLKVYAEYRRQHGLLSPDDIRAIREKYSLSQDAFASLLGTSPATLARYEGGSLQDKAYDQLLRACDNPSFMADLVERENHRLTPRQLGAVLAALKIARAENAAEGLLRWWRVACSESSDHNQPSIPALVEFAERTDQLARLPESRRAEMFFVVAIASAGHENPFSHLLKCRSLLRTSHHRTYVFERDQTDKASVVYSPSVAPPWLSILGDPNVPEAQWPRPSELRLMRRLAVQLEGQHDDDVHRSIVQFASKRLLRNKLWLEWISHNDWASRFVFPVPVPASELPALDECLRNFIASEFPTER